MEIEKMENWDILTYLREERKWMVQSHYTREDIAEYFNKTFTDNEWSQFCEFACDSFDNVKEEIMEAIVEAF